MPNPPRFLRWERDLADLLNLISFNEIRTAFPNGSSKKENQSEASSPEKYQAVHLIHPRLAELENFKDREDRYTFSRISLENTRDREKIHSLVGRIKYEAKSKEGRLSYDQHVRHVAASQKSAESFVHDLFVRHNKLQVLRLVLDYQTSQKQLNISYKDVQSHWKEFRRLIRMIDCAYIAKLAHSQERHYYFNLILFFPGNATVDSVNDSLNNKTSIDLEILKNTPHSSDVAISKIIEKLWKESSKLRKKKNINQEEKSSSVKEITNSFSFNTKNPLSLGLGTVERRESKPRNAIIKNILNPIFETDLYVRLMPPKKDQNSKHGDRTYWKGGEERLPLQPIQRGLPRKRKTADLSSSTP